MNEKLPLTIIIITDSSDAKFIQALKSSQIAQYVIIMDNKSNNEWTELRKEFSFNIISRETRIDNFANVRNELIELVKTEWVFFLDSDESLGDTPKNLEKNREKIEKIISNDLFDGISIIRRDIFLGKELRFGEAGNSSIVRLFKVKNGKFSHNVHEVAEIRGRLGGSEILVSHFSHIDISQFLSSVAIYAQMASKNEYTIYPFLVNTLKMILYPPLKFVHNYFFRLGLLDGYRGTIYALLMSFHSLFVRIYYFEKHFTKSLK